MKTRRKPQENHTKTQTHAPRRTHTHRGGLSNTPWGGSIPLPEGGGGSNPGSYLYIGGWGGESNREIVSFRVVRACVRARGAVCKVGFGKKTDPFRRPFPFPFWSRSLFPFPCRKNR